MTAVIILCVSLEYLWGGRNKNKLMNILLPTDFSENSEVALRYALDFVKKVNGKLTLANIYEVPTMEAVGMGGLDAFSSGPNARLQDRVEKGKQEEVEKQLTALGDKYGLVGSEYSVLAVAGNVRTEIDNILRDGDYDLVVLGTRGESSQRGMFFGGIANHLIQTAKCPVIAIPPGAQYREINKIIYPTDIVHTDTASLNWLIEFAKIYNARIHLLHVAENKLDAKEFDLNHMVEDLSYDYLDYELVENDKVSDSIVSRSFDDEVDAISMTTHTTTLLDKIFHSSLSTDVLGRIDVPFIGFAGRSYLD